ncbi:hypothetical protein GCM10027080_05650 [Pedococcus soli]
MRRSTWSLTFPDLDMEPAALLFTSLGGIYKHPSKYGEPFGRPTIVWELLGTPRGIYHLLSFPKELEPAVRGHLLSIVPNIGMEEVIRPHIPWRYVVEMTRHEQNEVEPDEKMVGILLTSMRDLADKEAAMVQLVITSTGAGLAGDKGNPFYVQGRIAAAGHEIKARQRIGMVQAAYRSLGVFSFKRLPSTAVAHVQASRSPLAQWPATMSARTLAVVGGLPIGSPQILGLKRGSGRKLIAVPSIPSSGFIIGTSTFPGAMRPIALDPVSALQHQWMLGGTGSGKSTLLHNEAVQIMEQGHGLILIEPKGDLARDVLGSVPRHRMQDVVWFDPTDSDNPVGLNVLAGSDPEHTATFITGLMRSLYSDSWGARLDYILRWSLQTAAMNGLTLYDVKHLLTNPEYRSRVVRGTHDIEVRNFWRRLDTGPDNQIDSVINKLDAFVGFSMMRNIVGQKSGLSIRDIVRNNKILLVPLDEKRINESNVAMLGSILVSQVWSEVGRRPGKEPTFLMLDEFQRFLRLAVSIEDALAQSRSYGMGLILANQYVHQLRPDSMVSSLIANARTKVVFGLGEKDANALSKSFGPLTASDLQLLGQYEVAVSMMTPEGIAPVATAKTLTAPRSTGHGPAIVAASRALYGRPVKEVEAEFIERFRSREEERQRPGIGRRRDAS